MGEQKKMKRLAALILALVFAAGLPCAAFASGGADPAEAAAPPAPAAQVGDMTAQPVPDMTAVPPTPAQPAPASDEGQQESMFKLPDYDWENDPAAKVDAPADASAQQPAAAHLDLPCRNAILISLDTGDVLYEQGPDDEVPIASITKVMTLLLTMEAVEQGKVAMTDIVPVSEHRCV